MNGQKIILLISLFCCPDLWSASKTFFMPRLITTDPTIELTLSNYAIYHGVNKYHSFISFFVSPFHQKSQNGNHVARYFFPNKQCNVIFDEQGDGNISSAWFDLVSTSSGFRSTFSMSPERIVRGGYLNLFINAQPCRKGLWGSITTSVINVKHHLKLHETRSPQQGTIDDIQTVIEALNNKNWCYGKFNPCPLTKTGLDDLQLKLGYNLFYLDEYHLGIYAVGTIPTGNRPTARYVFEPIVGTRFGSIGFGINSDLPIYYNADSEIVFMLDLKYRYLFASKQLRSFDLCRNGAWSRYLLFTTSDDTTVATPGINYLTQKARIKPRSTLDLWMAAHFARCNFHMELGYDLWYRVHEKIGTVCPLPDNISIFDLAGAVRGDPISASRATIFDTVSGTLQAPSDLIFTPIRVCDLNVRSAANPTVLTHKFFAGIAYDNCLRCGNYMIGGAASYEFARTCAALEQVTVWLTAGVQF